MHPRSASIAVELSREEQTAALYAEETAALVAAFLKTVGVKGKVRKPVELPAALLLAIGGLIRLRQWQHAGLGPLLGEGLPDAESSLATIHQEILQHGPTQVNPVPQSFWFTWTFHAWHRGFCHAASSRIESDLLVVTAPDEGVVSTIAKWIWQQRHSSVEGNIDNEQDA